MWCNAKCVLGGLVAGLLNCVGLVTLACWLVVERCDVGCLLVGGCYDWFGCCV